MEMQQLQSGARTERKKDLYILSLDGGRVFWVVSIALLVLVFLFLLGYWIGHDTVPARQGTTLDQPLAENGVPREMVSRGDLVPRDMASLKRDLERIGQAQPATGDDRATALTEPASGDRKDEGSESLRTASRTGRESEKPRIDETALTSKSEKREFETLRTKPKKQATQQVRETAAGSAKKSSQQVKGAAPRETGAAGKYLVQVASFSSRAGAESLVRRLQDKHYQASIVTSTVQGKEYFRVRVGGYESYDAASRVVANLKGSGDGSGSYIVQR